MDIVLDGERDDAPITVLHMHDAFEFGYCLSGSGTFYVGSKIIPFNEGDITVLTDREFHRCRSSPGTKSRWAWFFFDPMRLLVPHAAPSIRWESARFSGPRFTNVLRPDRFPRIAGLVKQLMIEARQKDDFSAANLRALLLLIVNELHRVFPKLPRTAKTDLNAQSLARIAPALSRIADCFDEPLVIPDLAERCGMSVRNFQLQFTRLIGHSPQQHLLSSRVQAAAALLADKDHPITDIAYTCGFSTLSSFNRAFRAAHRTSPREYRKRLLAAELGAGSESS